MGQEGVHNVVVKKGPFIHQNAFYILCKNRVFTEELHTVLGHRGLVKRQRADGKVIPRGTALRYWTILSDNSISGQSVPVRGTS